MPASLSEGGFFTSPIVATLLASPAAWRASAEAHLFALQRYFGIAPHLPTSTAPEVYRLDPGSALAHDMLGLELGRQGQLDEAVTCFRRAIELCALKQDAKSVELSAHAQRDLAWTSNQLAQPSTRCPRPNARRGVNSGRRSRTR